MMLGTSRHTKLEKEQGEREREREETEKDIASLSAVLILISKQNYFNASINNQSILSILKRKFVLENFHIFVSPSANSL